MNIEKKLKDEVNFTDERILETGKDLKAELIAEYFTPSKKAVASTPIYKKKSVVVSICCVVVFLLAVGICLPIFLNNEKPVHYLKENEVQDTVTLEGIYKVIEMQINEDNFTVTLPKIIRDSVSEDILYYRVKIDSKIGFPYGDVYFVTNKNYVLFEEEHEHFSNWNSSDVKYTELSDSIDSIPVNVITGCLEYNELRIYFTYTDIDLGVPVNPCTFLDSLFKN